MKAAVVGMPVGHSLSPAIWRAAFEVLGLDGWTYDAVDCDAEELERLVRRGGYAGLSVTMPHKKLAARLVDRRVGRTAGAVNTIVIGDEVLGYNTDVDGVGAALASVAPEAKRVAVLGAGGTAAAAVLAVQAAGGHATLVARNGAAALELKEQTGGMASFEPWTRAREVVAASEAVVNTTPAGAADDLAAGWAGAPLVEVIYDPWPTPLARAAEAGGHPVAGGLYVLVHQALRQIELVTGKRPEAEPLLAAGERALAERHAR